MCTVSFLPSKGAGFVFSSNRDEVSVRKTNPPRWISVGDDEVLMPEDQLSGGSWIGLNHKRRLCCVLNGAYEKHQRKAAYRKSRGLVLKEFLTAPDLIHYSQEYDFSGIESFTMVIVDQDKLYELIWDEIKLSFKELPWEARVWSSSTLYNAESKGIRKRWFLDHLNNYPSQSREELSSTFHRFRDNDNLENSILMSRDWIQTVSISQIRVSDDEFQFKYDDLLLKRESAIIGKW